jgi:hypothetical protein
LGEEAGFGIWGDEASVGLEGVGFEILGFSGPGGCVMLDERERRSWRVFDYFRNYIDFTRLSNIYY